MQLPEDPASAGVLMSGRLLTNGCLFLRVSKGFKAFRAFRAFRVLGLFGLSGFGGLGFRASGLRV